MTSAIEPVGSFQRFQENEDFALVATMQPHGGVGSPRSRVGL